MLSGDLEKMKIRALDMGAAEAAVVGYKDIVFNPALISRVRADDSFVSIHWPLFYPRDDLEEALRAYRRAIFFRMKIDADFKDYGGGPIDNESHRRIFSKVYEITSAIESEAFYLGYHLAMGLAAGNCRSVFCPHEKRCRPMLKGKTCLYPNQGRPSMEAAGIDSSAMSDDLNWNTAGTARIPVPCGLVMIA